MSAEFVSSKNDSRPHFEFAIAMPADRALAAMIRDVVAHGARRAGSAEERALNFALAVEDEVRELVGDVVSDERVGLLLQMHGSPLKVTISIGGDSRTCALDIEDL